MFRKLQNTFLPRIVYFPLIFFSSLKSPGFFQLDSSFPIAELVKTRIFYFANFCLALLFFRAFNLFMTTQFHLQNLFGRFWPFSDVFLFVVFLFFTFNRFLAVPQCCFIFLLLKFGHYQLFYITFYVIFDFFTIFVISSHFLSYNMYHYILLFSAYFSCSLSYNNCFVHFQASNINLHFCLQQKNSLK